jgi:proline racemase
MTLVKTIDAHVAGQPLRLVVDGLPRLGGQTLAQKRDWMRRRGDRFRRGILLEPRGHADLRGALLTEPISPGAHAGVMFMDADGYPPMSGHGIIGVATIALERRLLMTRVNGPPEGGPHDREGGPHDREGGPHDREGGPHRVVFDTLAGTVQARALIEPRGDSPRVGSVAFTNVPAFVHSAAHPVRLAGRELKVDIAFGGIFYAIVDTEAVGIPLAMAKLPELGRLAAGICRAVNADLRVAHPADASLTGVGGAIFTGPPQDPEADLRNVTVTAGGRVNRSPGGTSTSAVMAVLDAMGMLPEDRPFVHEGLLGTLFRGRGVRRTIVGDNPAIVTEIEGAAWITGEHTLFMDEDDPFREGSGC